MKKSIISIAKVSTGIPCKTRPIKLQTKVKSEPDKEILQTKVKSEPEKEINMKNLNNKLLSFEAYERGSGEYEELICIRINTPSADRILNILTEKLEDWGIFDIEIVLKDMLHTLCSRVYWDSEEFTSCDGEEGTYFRARIINEIRVGYSTPVNCLKEELRKFISDNYDGLEYFVDEFEEILDKY